MSSKRGVECESGGKGKGENREKGKAKLLGSENPGLAYTQANACIYVPS